MAEVIPCLVTSKVVLDDANDSALARAIHYAISVTPQKVGVISISLGRPKFGGIEDNIKKALRAARDAGIVVCAAAGQGIEWPKVEPMFPGSDPNTICVAACDYKQEKLVDGFYGPKVDITAPGVNVWIAKTERFRGTLIEVHSVKQSEGTSYATAIVAGACALWLAHHGRDWLISVYGRALIFELFKKVLKDSCHQPENWDTSNRGAGVLDAVALLDSPLPSREEIQQLRGTE